MKLKLEGLIAAPFTALHRDGSLNLDAIEQQAEHLKSNRVNGAFICGTTGEGLSLSTEERRKVGERWVAAAKGRLKIIVHVGHNSLVESRELARHAQQIGADAFATLAPSFFKPNRIELLVSFCAEVAAAASELPFYFYHMPAMTGVNLSMPEFLAAAGKRIPNLAGTKFTDENLMSYAQCVALENGRYNILFGRDEMLLAALALGATGAVGSTYNFMAPLYHEVIDAFHQGDLAAARSSQLKANELIGIMSRYGGLPAGKAMMAMAGVDCGPVRLPLSDLSKEALEAFRRELQGSGFPLPSPGSTPARAKGHKN